MHWGSFHLLLCCATYSYSLVLVGLYDLPCVCSAYIHEQAMPQNSESLYSDIVRKILLEMDEDAARRAFGMSPALTEEYLLELDGQDGAGGNINYGI